MDVERRKLIKAVGVTAASAGIGVLLPSCRRGKRSEGRGTRVNGIDRIARATDKGEKEDPVHGRYYRADDDGFAHCELCFHECRISQGGAGFCRNRVNRKGRLYNIVYNRPSSVAVDPTEKEPLHHFFPATDMLCIGTASCNLRCKFCQNWELSQRDFEEMIIRYSLTPEEIVAAAKRAKVVAISYTYNEPAVFYEYMYDIAVEGRKAGLRSIMHSNGGMKSKPLAGVLPHIDAATIDLKAFNPEYYKEICRGELEPVLETLKAINADDGTWLEIVNLVLPGHNDSPEEIRKMCGWIMKNLGPDVPMHFSRFFPAHAMRNLSPTPISTLERARAIAMEEGLNYVAIGNVPGHDANSTYCPKCKTRVIRRHHFKVLNVNMKDGACGKCGNAIPGVWG